MEITFGKANKCNNKYCKRRSNHYEWSNIFHTYKKDIRDWEMLCRSCHLILDRGEKCRNGHVRTKENTYIYSNGHRRCNICQTIVRNRRRASGKR